tara:strand:+ start:9 stop:551 length:543 start_codon:yes stop_codon:yes gene_type:complete
MNSNEIFEDIYEQLDTRIIGGDLGCQDQAKEWVSGFLVTLENYQELLDIDWYVVIPSRNSTAQQLHFFRDRSPWFITINGELKDKDDFVQTFAHELAHVFYNDNGAVPRQFDGPPLLWMAIAELRADLKMERWGALSIREDTYLYGGGWEQFKKSVSKEEALSFAKIEDTDEIINQYSQH